MKPGIARPNPRAAYRDKRYTIPVLSFDLFEKILETRLWSFSQVIMTKYEGIMPPGTVFTGTFRFDDNSDTGLFEAKVAKLDTAKQMLGAEFTWISKPGFALLEKLSKNRTPDTPNTDIPTMKISLTYPTINWSLSGALLGNYWGPLKDTDPFNGMIRVEKAQESGVFSGIAIKNNPDRHTLAMKFTSVSPELFELLEAAMKKNPSGM